MAVPYGMRFPTQFDELFRDGTYVVGEVTRMRAVNQPSGMGNEAKPCAAVPGSADARSAAA